MFGNLNDDPVIITQYGPMRYNPVTVDEMNRPYDNGDKGSGSGRGYYKAEIIPLDMNTWKPILDSGENGTGRRTVVKGGVIQAGGDRVETFNVPLRVGYLVRPTMSERQRRNDYLLMGYPPPLTKYHHSYPGVRLSTRPIAVANL